MTSFARTSILLVGNFLSDTGSRGVTENLAEELRARGAHVRMTSRQPGRIARLLDMVRTTWRSRQQCDVAVVDLYSGPAIVWAAAVCLVWRLAGKSYIFTLHGGNLPTFSARWPRLMRWVLHSAAAVTVPSPYLLDQMRTYRADLRLHPNGVNLDHHTFRPRAHVRPNLVWVRSFHHTYNPCMAVEVLAEVRRDFPEAALTMIGPDKGDGSRQATEAAAERLGVRDRVTFTGRVDARDVPAWLDRADIFLNTTNVDNTPVSVIEAMASGLGVVSTDVGGLPYLVQHEKEALLVPRADIAAMAAAVRRILRDPACAARLSSAARARAAQFDWSAVIPQWQRLLAETMDTPRASGRRLRVARGTVNER